MTFVLTKEREEISRQQVNLPDPAKIFSGETVPGIGIIGGYYDPEASNQRDLNFYEVEEAPRGLTTNNFITEIIGGTSDEEPAGIIQEAELSYYQSHTLLGAIDSLLNALDKEKRVVQLSVNIWDSSEGRPDGDLAEGVIGMMQPLVERAEEAGLLIVTPGGDCPDTEAADLPLVKLSSDYDNILVVGSCAPSDEQSPYNMDSSELDILAPGYSISGVDSTSIAAAFVTGGAGLALSANPELSPEEIKELLFRSARSQDVSGAENSPGILNIGGILAELYYSYQNLNSEEDEQEKKTVSVAVSGDTTLGGDSRYSNLFKEEFERQDEDYGFFLRNVKPIFEENDIALTNLEGTLTERTAREDKKFTFRASPHFVNVLKEGGITAVNLANNHTMDFGKQGYKDTKETLREAGIGYFGDDIVKIKEVDGITVALMGFTGWREDYHERDEIEEQIQSTSDEHDLTIVSFHWGIERQYHPENTQKVLGRLAIDSGADLVWGHHPHVVQGIEEYEGKKILYSLGNFSFGGNTNPQDHDTFIYQKEFTFKGEKLKNSQGTIIPCSISSVEGRNNFQPTLVEGEEKTRIKEKIEDLSKW